VLDVDDLRGVSLAALHAFTTAAMIVGVPVLIGRRLAVPQAPLTRSGPLITAAAATVVATALTVATRRTAWGLVRLWLRMDDQPSGR